MLIKALTDYYDILKKDGKVTEEGYTLQKVHYKVLISSEGRIEDIVSCQREEVNEKGKSTYYPVDEVFPERNGKPGIASEILEHRPKYLFGLSYDNKNDVLVEEKEKKSGRSLFDFCKEVNLEFIEGVDSEIALAYKRFLESWKPENETENPLLKALGKNLDKYSYSIALSGKPKETLQGDRAVIEKWENVLAAKKGGATERDKTCSVLGKTSSPVARIHNNKIKGIPNGQPSGCVLVGTNNPAEYSYGKEQAYNSGISEEAALKYTKAFNYLLSGREHKSNIDDVAVVFWAEESGEDVCSDIFQDFFFDNDKPGAKEADLSLKSIFDHLREGKKSDTESFFEKFEQTFYIVGVTPNNSRISLRFVYKNTFDKILRGVSKFYEDTMLEGMERPISLYQIKRELVSPKSTREKVSPSLTTDIFKAVIWGGKMPMSLLNTLVRRVKTDKKENVVRVGVLKACVNRQKEEEAIKMALDKTNNNPAYLCGRLFALLEEIQRRSALPAKLNRTIKEGYFSSACSNPSRVFPTLMKLSEHHINKIEKHVWLDMIKCEILDKFEKDFPATLSLVEQGEFIIGYYQQKQNFFTAKKEEEE